MNYIRGNRVGSFYRVGQGTVLCPTDYYPHVINKEQGYTSSFGSIMNTRNTHATVIDIIMAIYASAYGKRVVWLPKGG